MKKQLIIWATLAATCTWGATSRDSAFDYGSDSSVYEGGCKAPYGSDYDGALLTPNSTTLAQVHVREARAARRFPSRVTIKVTPTGSRSTIQYIAKNCSIPCAGTAVSTDGTNRKIRFIITWDYLVGTDEDGNQVLAATDGDIDSIVVDPQIALIGYHTLALEARDATSGESLGYAGVSINLKKNGRFSASVKMPDGWAFTNSGKIRSENGQTYFPIAKSRRTGGGQESVSFTVVIDDLQQTVSVEDASAWVSTAKKFPVDADLAFVSGGTPSLTTAEYRHYDKLIQDFDEAQIKSTRLATKTGLVSGTFSYFVTNSRGKRSRKTGKLYGVDVDGEVFGSAFIRNSLSRRFIAVQPE